MKKMMKKRNDKVLDCLVSTHAEAWSKGSDVSPQTKKSSKVTELWQSKVEAIDKRRFKKEFAVLEEFPKKYRIDVVDLKRKIAYELKASKNNPQHEFYKDIFKVALANRDSKKFNKLFFCVEESAKSSLGLLGEFAETESKKLGFEVEIYYF